VQVEVVMPKMGESIQEGKVIRWTRKVGEKITKDETLLEISTDKVDSEIPSPATGTLAKILVQEQETVPIGTTLAMIETEVSTESAHPAEPGPSKPEERKREAEIAAPQLSEAAPKGQEEPPEDARFYSPLVKTIAQQEGITRSELDLLSGSGAGGRVTKNDVLSYLEERANRNIATQRSPRRSAVPGDGNGDLRKKYPEPQYRIVQMNNLQEKMAEHMVRSMATSPHVAAIDEVDVTAIAGYRAREAARFEKSEGFKLTYTPFFADAAVKTLKEFPIVNSSVVGNAIIYKNFVNLGIAVASPSGLIVPVVRGAEEKNFTGLARAINDIAVRTRNKKLMPDEVADGTFSITNYGVFGNTIGTPIINQPQVAILGIGAIRKRPIVVADAQGSDCLAIRSTAYLTLSFDHRIIDGAIGGQFLARVKWHLENFAFQEILS
jgi:pyruvate/2-oxoglutarate dehydrogenase complex dihydrolipoamide acyltransferase (E2) component